MDRSRVVILTIAGIGGAASSLLDLAATLTRGEPWSFGPGYFLGGSVFFAFGCLLAWIFEEDDRRRALFVGLSMPAFFATAQTQIDAGSRQMPQAVEPTPVGQVSLFRVVPSVHARTDSASPMQDASEERRAGPTAAREKDILKIRLRKECPDCVVVWTVNGEQRQGRVEDLLSDDDVVSIEAASGSTRFGIWNMQINPKMWVVPSDGARTYEFDYDGNRWNDFRRGFGNYNIRPYDSIVTVARD